MKVSGGEEISTATTLLPTQAVLRPTKAQNSGLTVPRIPVLRCAWVVLVLLRPLLGTSYESVGQRFESSGARHSLNNLEALLLGLPAAGGAWGGSERLNRGSRGGPEDCPDGAVSDDGRVKRAGPTLPPLVRR